MLYAVKKLNFDFDFSTTNLTAGSFAETGDDAEYQVYDGSKWTNEYQLDEQSIMEIAGIELIGPVDPTGVRSKLEYVRLRINGEEYKHVNLNELMAPAYNAYEPNGLRSFFGGMVKVGESYNQLPNNFCHNIGIPMLLGGAPTEAVPKVGPGQKISIEVRAPRATEGGATIDDDMMVRLSVVECRSTEMFEKLGAQFGWLTGGQVNQSFVFRDLEENGDIAETSVDKSVDMTAGGGGGAGINLGNWTECYGGLDAKKPYIYPFIRYANNATATTTNEEYTFTKASSRVLHDEMVFDWNFEKKEALQLQYIGVDPHANHAYTRVYIQGRDSNPYAMTPDGVENEYPMPVDRTQPPLHYHGPAPLGRGAIIWNTKGYIGIKDNGTSIPAWGTAPTRGTTVATWGKYYRFY